MKTLSFYKIKQQSLFAILLTLFLMIFSFFGCNEITEPTMENTNHTELSKLQIENYETIKTIAKGLSVFLKQENNRKKLRKLLDNSKYSENIIESSEFLNDNKEKIALLLSNKEKTSFLEKAKTVKFGQYDIYFPEKEWRDNWKPSNELYIAAVGYRNENDKSSILAFDLTGNELHLSSEEIPSKPTLVIYPSEKNGKYDKNNGATTPLAKTIGSTVQSNYKSFCKKYYIDEDYDDHWWLGDMEIYFKIKWHYTNSSTWSSWQRIDMNMNTDVDVWTTVNKLLVSKTENFEMMIQVWEEDDSSPDDYVSGEEWDDRYRTDPYHYFESDVSVLPCINSPYRLHDYYEYETSGEEYDNYVDIENELPPPPPNPLAMTISGPTTLYGSPNNSYSSVVNNLKSKKNSVLAPVESATGTWTANATDGSGSYSYQWYSRNSSTNDWFNLSITTKNLTKTIYNDIEFKCIVTSGNETVSDEISVDFVPSGSSGEF